MRYTYHAHWHSTWTDMDDAKMWMVQTFITFNKSQKLQHLKCGTELVNHSRKCTVKYKAQGEKKKIVI